VVDPLILNRFFAGHLDHLGYHDSQGKIIPTIRQLLYRSRAGAIERCVQYFENPPQIENLMAYVKRRDTNLPIFHAGNLPRMLESYQVELPVAELREFVKTQRSHSMHQAFMASMEMK